MDFDNIKKIARNSAIGMIISLFFLLINGLGSFRFLYDWTNYVTEPISFGVGQFSKGVKNIFDTVVAIGSLKDKNATLVSENEELLAEIEKCSELELQNQILLSQLGTETTKGMKMKLARILGVDINGTSEHVIIDLGSDDGVKAGNTVVVGDIFVGEVRDVYKSTSRVRLVTNRNSNILALDKNTRAKGLVRGSLNGLVLEDVLENEEVNIGDVIIVWSDDFPKNLVIGTVKNLENDATASTKKAYLNPGVSLENLNYVFVIVNE